MYYVYRLLTGTAYSEGGNRRWSHTVCDVHVSVYGKPDHLRTIQYRFRSLRGIQVMKYFELARFVVYLFIYLFSSTWLIHLYHMDPLRREREKEGALVLLKVMNRTRTVTKKLQILTINVTVTFLTFNNTSWTGLTYTAQRIQILTLQNYYSLPLNVPAHTLTVTRQSPFSLPPTPPQLTVTLQN